MSEEFTLPTRLLLAAARLYFVDRDAALACEEAADLLIEQEEPNE